MFVSRLSGFIYRDEGSKLCKSFFKSVDCRDALNFQGDYLIGEAFFGGCWLSFAYWDELTKMRKTLINKLDIIIHHYYLKGMDMHGNVL